MPLGNLTSQVFANIYLNELDQFIKHELRIKYYLRYADDFLLILKDSRCLETYTEQIKTFLYKDLKLLLHPKKINIRRLDNGIDFLGYIILPHIILPRTKTKRRIFKKLKEKFKDFNDGQISEMESSQSDQFKTLAEMRAITPPQGTVIYDTKSDRSWGVKYVMHGPIIMFRKPNEAQKTEGTLLWFNPGEIKVHVIKNNLTEAEINQIGRLCFELDRENHILSYLPRTIEQTEKLKSDLENEHFLDAHGAYSDISGIGVTLHILRDSLPGHRKCRDRLAGFLYEMGVTLVESETKSTRDGVTPIALIADKNLQKPPKQT